MKNLYKILYLIIIVILFTGCKEDSNNPLINTNEVKVNPNAKVVSSIDFQNNIVSFSSDSSVITMSPGVSNVSTITAGNILVTDNGKGMIRKINNLQTVNGNLVMNTTQASLTDVFEKLSLSFEKQLTASDTASIDPGDSVTITYIKRDASNLLEITLGFERIMGGAILSGEVTFSISYNLNLLIDNYTLQSGSSVTFTTSANVKINGGFGVNLPFESKIRLFNVNFVPFVIPGPTIIPIVVTPNNEIYLKLDAEGRVTATAEVTSGISTTAGVSYTNGNWNTILTESHNFSFVPPGQNIVLDAELKASIDNIISLRLYGIVGPFLRVSPYLSLEATTSPPIRAEMYGGIEGAVGVIVKILGATLAYYENPLALTIRERLWELALNGKISGSVRQAGTLVPISGCLIQAKRNGQVIQSGSSISDGTYEISLPAASDYEIVYSKSGFITANYFNVGVQNFNTTYIETILQVQNSSTPGTISGIVTNATTGQGVSGISLKLRNGYNNTNGSIISTASTLGGGVYTFNNIQPGNYTVEASGSGYNTTYFSTYCVGGINSGNQNATITPNGQNFQWRIVLTWGEFPSDLDAHFTGPLSSGGRFHIYYANRIVSGVGFLDVDDVTSYGPETITLTSQIPGTYRYSVHDYTNRNLTTSTALSNSGAIVKVYKGNVLRATFPIPPGQGGTLWKVCEIIDDNILPLNTFHYVSNPASITFMEDNINIPFEKHEDNKNY